MATLNYTVRIIDRLLRFDTTHGNAVVTLLPFAQTPNAPYEIHRVSFGDGNTVTLQADPTTSDYLLPDGSTSITLDDTNYWVIVKIPGDASSPAFVTMGGGGGGGGTGGGAAKTVVGYDINDATTGVNVGPMLVSPGPGSVSQCVTIVKRSDPAIDLTFDIKQNSASVFTAPLTISAGAATGAITSAGLTSSSLTLAAGDIFTIDVTGGSDQWAFTTQLEE